MSPGARCCSRAALTGPAVRPTSRGSSPQLLERAGRSYLASILELADIEEGTLARWTAVMAVARMPEGVEPKGLRARSGTHGGLAAHLTRRTDETWTLTSAPRSRSS